jgi:hypothetical protein
MALGVGMALAHGIAKRHGRRAQRRGQSRRRPDHQFSVVVPEALIGDDSDESRRCTVAPPTS